MEHILEIVIGFEMFSLLDGFLGYNQVLVLDEDILKTSFKTKWALTCPREYHLD
jgi:hypothetical protein